MQGRCPRRVFLHPFPPFFSLFLRNIYFPVLEFSPCTRQTRGGIYVEYVETLTLVVQNLIKNLLSYRET